MPKTYTVTFSTTIRTAAIGMLKEGLKSPTIARLLGQPQSAIELHMGWWVHDRMRSVAGRTYRAYRAAAAADLRVSFQSVMKWHLSYLLVCQVSKHSELISEATEEYARQTPNVQREMQAKLLTRSSELALLREFGLLK